MTGIQYAVKLYYIKHNFTCVYLRLTTLFQLHNLLYVE
jgi:hypothetical protein